MKIKITVLIEEKLIDTEATATSFEEAKAELDRLHMHYQREQEMEAKRLTQHND